jgi:DNA mismatch repair protein PMS2
MSTIQAIDRQSITKICSGQVVVDLATAVKEMVENSLDSGATSVEVKLKEMGSDSIEITDNGSGIDPVNYANIALKHHTSKLSEFSDLNSVSSFGFRGEALNALCELSEAFTVTTKIEAEGIGSRLLFGKDGHLLSTNPTARTTGTTVVVSKLFASLPVRRGEFIRTIKKQYQKMIKGLQSYAIIAVGVRMVVTNSGKGSSQMIMGTQLGNRMCDNISSIFGSKFLSTLIPISVTIQVTADLKDCEGEVQEGSSQGMNNVAIEDEESQNDIGGIENSAAEQKERLKISSKDDNKCDDDSKYCTITGFVSKAGSGVGRSDNDRQFLYCNGRPVDIPKFSKALNEVWRRYEMKHKPACFLDIRVPNGSFDVNLTPDKREIVLTHEGILLEKFRENLEKLYVPSRQTFQLSQGLGGTQQGLFEIISVHSTTLSDGQSISPSSEEPSSSKGPSYPSFSSKEPSSSSNEPSSSKEPSYSFKEHSSSKQPNRLSEVDVIPSEIIDKNDEDNTEENCGNYKSNDINKKNLSGK